MNGTTLESDDIPDNIPQRQSISGFGYDLELSLGLIFFIILLTYACYVCNCKRRRSSIVTTETDSTAATEQGLDELTLHSYPKFLYYQAKLHNGGDSAAAASGCSICLADYNDSDMLRLLPECGHLFHLKCIDPWLRLNPTCPICRNLPVGTPRETPSAELEEVVVVPH